MEKSMAKPASLFAALGKGFTLNGVTAVVSSGASEAVLKTESGVIRLRGENFNVTKVDLEAGVVDCRRLDGGAFSRGRDIRALPRFVPACGRARGIRRKAHSERVKCA